MPRRNQATIRLLEPDSVYRSRLVQQLINKVMSDGKKSLAEQITTTRSLWSANGRETTPWRNSRERSSSSPPSWRCAHAASAAPPYQVPVEVPARRARTLAIRWLVEFARARGEKSMPERLANEILDASKQQGNAWKRKDDIYRMAQANKAFAHYRW
jgi:small subunit ribosomal protein S7